MTGWSGEPRDDIWAAAHEASDGHSRRRRGTRAAAPLELLRARGWLAQLPPEQQLAILSRGHVRASRRGEEIGIGREDMLVAIVGGACRLYARSDRGEGPLFHYARPGAWLAAMPGLTATPFPFHVVAAEESQLFVVPANELRPLLLASNEHWRAVAQLLAQTLAVAAHVFVDLHTSNLRCRLARRILGLLGREAGLLILDGDELHVSQKELGDAVAASRNSVAGALRGLAEDRLIEIGFRRLKVLDVQGLSAAADATSRARRGHGGAAPPA